MNNNNNEYIQSDTTQFVAGVDEVARGTFIGPVIAACVVLPHVLTDDKYKQIKDSKTLSEKKRTELARFIKENAITYGIGTASVEEIDDINILHATMRAMHRAIDEAYKKHTFDKLLIDGQYFKGYTPPGLDGELLDYECIPKGDKQFLSIAAASIIAKDYHTNLINEMVDTHQELNTYDIRKNKGYGTPKHLAAINKHGITDFHRKTFGICKYIKD
jgi:ribonuclease HII|uniref:Ribonuclease HII n=1 Tax=viral metagenome TaxID=1070528 RepID=A0A6C0L9V5_9ZZZZ